MEPYDPNSHPSKSVVPWIGVGPPPTQGWKKDGKTPRKPRKSQAKHDLSFITASVPDLSHHISGDVSVPRVGLMGVGGAGASGIVGGKTMKKSEKREQQASLVLQSLLRMGIAYDRPGNPAQDTTFFETPDDGETITKDSNKAKGIMGGFYEPTSDDEEAGHHPFTGKMLTSPHDKYVHTVKVPLPTDDDGSQSVYIKPVMEGPHMSYESYVDINGHRYQIVDRDHDLPHGRDYQSWGSHTSTWRGEDIHDKAPDYEVGGVKEERYQEDRVPTLEEVLRYDQRNPDRTGPRPANILPFKTRYRYDNRLAILLTYDIDPTGHAIGVVEGWGGVVKPGQSWRQTDPNKWTVKWNTADETAPKPGVDYKLISPQFGKFGHETVFVAEGPEWQKALGENVEYADEVRAFAKRVSHGWSIENQWKGSGAMGIKDSVDIEGFYRMPRSGREGFLRDLDTHLRQPGRTRRVGMPTFLDAIEKHPLFTETWDKGTLAYEGWERTKKYMIGGEDLGPGVQTRDIGTKEYMITRKGPKGERLSTDDEGRPEIYVDDKFVASADQPGGQVGTKEYDDDEWHKEYEEHKAKQGWQPYVEMRSQEEMRIPLGLEYPPDTYSGGGGLYAEEQRILSRGGHMPNPPQKYLEQPISPRGISRGEYDEIRRFQKKAHDEAVRKQEVLEQREKDRLHNIKWKKIREGQHEMEQAEHDAFTKQGIKKKKSRKRFTWAKWKELTPKERHYYALVRKWGGITHDDEGRTPKNFGDWSYDPDTGKKLTVAQIKKRKKEAGLPHAQGW
jgi:hypothetical protein